MSWIDIITAIGTAGAAVVALALGSRAEWRAIKVERKEQARERAVQASHVAGWMSELVLKRDQYPEIRIRLRNGSDLPIYMVAMKVAVGTRGTFIRTVQAMGPGETREFRIWLPATPRADVYAPELMFGDASNRRWIRNSTGELRELDESECLHFEEDPGSYMTIENHPTLHLPEDDWRNGGQIVS